MHPGDLSNGYICQLRVGCVSRDFLDFLVWNRQKSDNRPDLSADIEALPTRNLSCIACKPSYLELSYQTLRLPAWAGNPSVRLIKSPKLIWFDTGVQRVLSGQTGGLTGEQYESTIIAQILTTLWSYGLRVSASYLRTAGGLEVDLVLEGQDGLLAVEIKRRPDVEQRDASSLERARRLLGDRYRGGLVVHRGSEVARLTDSVFGVPDWRLLGT